MTALANAGVRVLADEFSLRERGISPRRLADGVAAASLDVVIDGLAAYEGAVALPFARQAPHANAVHGRDVVEEDHPNPRDWVTALFTEARRRGVALDWVQCGLCVDERGTTEWVPGPRRGGPADLVAFAAASDNVLVIPTR